MTNVIIIEDDPMVAAINKKYLLRNEDVNVAKIFSNGHDALQYLEANPVDLALVDVYMPQLSGIDLLRLIREKQISVDVIMITAANDSQSIDIALKLGIIDYLIKPFEFDRFQQAIQKYFAKINFMDKKMDSLVSQTELDQMLNKTSILQHSSLEKGMQQKTLDLIRHFMEKHRGMTFSNDQIAQQIGLSRVTVHRYLNFLESQKLVDSSIDYETKGRPGIKYTMH